MILVGIDEELCRDATQAGGIESSEALIGVDAIVFLAMDAENGRVPLVYKAMGAVVIGAFGCCSLVMMYMDSRLKAPPWAMKHLKRLLWCPAR